MRPAPALLAASLAACAHPPRANPTLPAPSPPPPVTPAAPSPPVACALDAGEVRFASPLTLLGALPPPDAMVEHPFASVRAARRLHVEALAGDATTTPARVSVDTTMAHLDGVARASTIPLYPGGPAPFARMVIPLARHPLRWVSASLGTITVTPSPSPRASLLAPPEERRCEDLRLAPVDDFDPVELPPAASRRTLPLGPGRWHFYPTPTHEDGPSVAVDLVASDLVWRLEDGPERWARVLWTTGDVAVVAWVDQRTHVRPQIGHGSGTGTGARRGVSCPRATTCADDVPLLAIDRGEARGVGRLLRGARVMLGATEGGRTAVTVCDPDVEWADGVGYAIPSERAAVCAGR